MNTAPLPRLLLLLLLVLSACATGEPPAGEVAERPNIIFIMADDLGYGDLGAYGQRIIRTPHLDRMAAEGTRFTDFYAGSTVCAPSRSALMTGQHTGHTLVRGNVGWPRGDMPLRPEDPSLGRVLQQAGYATGAFGKWALGLKNTTGAPHRQGFDAFFGYEDQSEAHHYRVERLQQITGGETVDVEVDPTTYSHDLVVEHAFDFIRTHAEERPFFVYLPVTIPHADLDVPEASLAPYLNEQGESLLPEPRNPEAGSYRASAAPNATYAAMVSHLDRDVGRLLELLEELGVAENTLVFFTSDNGPHSEGGHDPSVTDSNGPLRGIKRDLYEGGIRVPMIAWGPGRIPAGRVSDQVWAAWDVLPTLAELSGTSAPDGIDGLSMVDALQGDPQREHEYLYWEFYHGGTETFRQAARLEDWKAVRFTKADGQERLELYDLSEDLDESNDVSASHPEVAARLGRIMDAAHEEPHPEFQVFGTR